MLSKCGAGEDTESPLDSKKIKPVNRKGNQSWIFIGRTHAEAETPIIWPSAVKSRFTGKDPDAVKNWGQEEKGETEDEMSRWHHWLNGYNFEQAQQDSEGQGSLGCCSPWVHEELDLTEQLNNNLSFSPCQFQFFLLFLLGQYLVSHFKNVYILISIVLFKLSQKYPVIILSYFSWLA